MSKIYESVKVYAYNYLDFNSSLYDQKYRVTLSVYWNNWRADNFDIFEVYNFLEDLYASRVVLKDLSSLGKKIYFYNPEYKSTNALLEFLS